MLYPLKFKKILKEKIWGGRQLNEILNFNLSDNKLYGESWEVSSNKDDISIVDSGELAGKSLKELITLFKDKLLGAEIYEEYKSQFPLLIKYLDINDKLSVQVHPSDDYALEVEGEFGKAECWYVINASSDAKIIAGLKDGVNKEFFIENIANNNFSNLFNVVSVKTGDFINIKPGTIHATVEGSILICEIQQNSDATYRIYDFDRIVNGELRPLHIDKAVEVIEYSQKPEISSKESRNTIALENIEIQELVKCKYFNVDKLIINGSYNENIYKNFIIYSILKGSGTINYKNEKYSITQGDTYFIPQGLEISIDGQVELIKSYI